MLVTTMARKKRSGPGRPKGPSVPRKMIAAFKGTEDFSQWIKALMRHCRMPASSIIENALIDYAKKVGFDEEAPER